MTATNQSSLELKAVSVRVGGLATGYELFAPLSESFEPQQVTAIMGTSGSGKSTLLHVAAGLRPPTSGGVLLGGQDLTLLSERRLSQVRRDQFGFVFQTYNLLPSLTVYDNVALPLRLRRDRQVRALRVTIAGMQRVVFMCGPAGSGKSTRARRLEAEGMARLSFDQTAWELGHRSMPLPAEVHGQIARQLRSELERLLQEGRDVVLDFSFWSRRMRDEWRAVVEQHGLVPETVYLATDRETVLARIRERAGGDGDDFELDHETAARYFDAFQPPTPEEGPLTVVS